MKETLALPTGSSRTPHGLGARQSWTEKAYKVNESGCSHVTEHGF